MLVLLLACLHPVEPETLPAGNTPAPVVEVVADVQYPPGWNTGQQLGPELKSTPYEAWVMVLDGPVVGAIQSDGTNFYMVGGGTAVSVDAKGSVRWKKKVGGTGLSLNEAGLVLSLANKYQILNPATGEPESEHVAPGLVGSPFWVSSGLAWLDNQNVLHGPGWDLALGGTPVGAPALDHNEGTTIFWGTREAELLCVRVLSGVATLAWKKALPGPAVASVALAPELVVVPIAAEDISPGGVVAFNYLGDDLWRFRTGYQPGGTPAVGRSVWVADRDGGLYALDPQTGVEQWRIEGDTDLQTAPIWVGSSLYVGDNDGRLRRINLDGNAQVWTYSAGAPVVGTPVLVQGLLVAGTLNGRVFAISE